MVTGRSRSRDKNADSAVLKLKFFHALLAAHVKTVEHVTIIILEVIRVHAHMDMEESIVK